VAAENDQVHALGASLATMNIAAPPPRDQWSLAAEIGAGPAPTDAAAMSTCRNRPEGWGRYRRGRGHS
jgi:predicted signal transduction protein with EAL and GGDEF domain